jgi:drug/metabolite transporter (DMT)-like permease
MQFNQSAIQWPGVPLALGSAVLFGAATPLSKLLLASIGPQMLAGLLYLGAGLKAPALPRSASSTRALSRSA